MTAGSGSPVNKAVSTFAPAPLAAPQGDDIVPSPSESFLLLFIRSGPVLVEVVHGGRETSEEELWVLLESNGSRDTFLDIEGFSKSSPLSSSSPPLIGTVVSIILTGDTRLRWYLLVGVEDGLVSS